MVPISSLSSGIGVGPTWQRDDQGRPLQPKYTLGRAVTAWAVQNLRQPDGPNAGSPWHFTHEQYRFLLWWYAIDESGRFVYRRGVLRRLKGWG